MACSPSQASLPERASDLSITCACDSSRQACEKIDAASAPRSCSSLYAAAFCQSLSDKLTSWALTGGKWTTYRKMAQDAIDLAVKQAGLQHASGCRTVHLPLIGASGGQTSPVLCLQMGQESCLNRICAGYTPDLFTHVAQHYTVPHRPGAIDTRVAKHLAGELAPCEVTARHQQPAVADAAASAAAYGDRASEVTRIAEQQGLGRRLARGHPMLEAEVIYAVRL